MTKGIRACIRGKIGDDRDEFSDDELQAIIDELEGRRQSRASRGMPDGGSDQLYRDAARLAYDAKLEAALTKRAVQINIKKKAEMRQRISKFSLDKSTAGTGAKIEETVTNEHGVRMLKRHAGGMADVQGLMAQISPSNKRVDSAQVSVENQQLAYHKQFMGEMYKDLKRAGLDGYVQARKRLGVGFGAGALDKEITQELWQINSRDGRPGISGSKEARQIAEIIHKHMDRARIVLNRNGAWIRELNGYIATQSHDRMKLQTAGFEKWFADVIPGLDVARTFGKELNHEQLVDAMQAVYGTLSTGNYSDDVELGPVVDLGVNLGKKVSQHRVLHFMDADAWLAYNNQYGPGSLFKAINNTMTRAARTAGLMSIFGPNPRKMMEDMAQELISINRGNATVQQRLGKNSGMLLHRLMDVADGTVDQVVDPKWAVVGQVAREFETATGLGGALASSLTTDPTTSAVRLTFNGINAFEAAHASTVGLVGENREFAEDLAFGLDHMAHDVSNTIHGGDSVSAYSSALSSANMNLTLMPQWDRLRERGMVATLGRNLWGARGRHFDNLNRRLRATLATYGIDAAHWDVIRRFGAVEREGGEHGVISGSAMRRVPDSEILALLGRERATAQAMDNKRDELEMMIRMYYSGEIEHTLARPTYRTKALTTSGGKRGTLVGEVSRSLFLWKGYTLNFMQRVIGQFTEEDNYVPSASGLWAMPASHKVQLAGMVAALTVGGYASMCLKDISKGRTPRDPKDPKTWLAAFVQGGGAGIYGDFLFGSSNRYGANPLTTLMGPVFADAGVLAQFVSDAATGKGIDPVASYNLIKTNTPLVNLFYARAAFDYLILYRIQEWLNPGSLKRMERRLKQDSNQTYLLPPSQAIR